MFDTDRMFRSSPSSYLLIRASPARQIQTRRASSQLPLRFDTGLATVCQSALSLS